MKKSLFVCYSREDYEFVASFELEFVKAKNSSQIFVNSDVDIELKIDKAPGVINLGDRYQEKIEKTIENSNGAVVFISNSSSNSEFINNVEIPKILEIKRSNPDYIILPVFVDDSTDPYNEILTYQAPNSQNSALRNLSGDLKSLVFKNFVNDLIKNIVEMHEESKRMHKDVNHEQNNAGDKKTRSRLIGFILIALLSIFYTLPFTESENEATPIVINSLEQSCEVFFNHYNDLETLYDTDFINALNNSIEIWNSYIGFYDSDQYREFSAEEQKEYHTQNGLYRFEDDLDNLNKIIVSIEVQGLGDVAEEHVELKRLLNNTQRLAISNTQNGIELIQTYIDYRNNIETYYEDWETTVDTAKVEQVFNELDLQLYEKREVIREEGDNLDRELNDALQAYMSGYQNICG